MVDLKASAPFRDRTGDAQAPTNGDVPRERGRPAGVSARGDRRDVKPYPALTGKLVYHVVVRRHIARSNPHGIASDASHRDGDEIVLDDVIAGRTASSDHDLIVFVRRFQTVEIVVEAHIAGNCAIRKIEEKTFNAIRTGGIRREIPIRTVGVKPRILIIL